MSYANSWKTLSAFIWNDVTPEQQKPVTQLVDQILAAKRTDPKADTADLEAEVDQLVYRAVRVDR